jgi:hypothetical protein
MSRAQKIWLGVGIGFVSLLFIALLIRAMFFTFIDNYEFGYRFDARSGELHPLINSDGTLKQGYVFSYPFVEKIHTIEMRPMQVCINANSRVLNCKLVEFNPEGFETFIAWHGRGDYSQMNLKDILMSYAYDPSNKKYNFLTIKKELKNEDVDYSLELVDNDDLNIVKDTINTIK